MSTNQPSRKAIQPRLHCCQSQKPCGSQKLLPNHQFSFSWTCLLPSTPWIIRSFCLLSHHSGSLELPSTGLSPISQVVAWGRMER